MTNEVRVRVVADTAKATQNMNAFQEKGKALGGVLQNTLRVGALAAAGGLIALGASSIKAASDFNENLNKVRVVFGQSSKEIEAFAHNARTSLGLSESAALSAAGTFGNLFTSMKLSRPVAAEMSTGILQLAADLASFNNIKPEEALEKLRSGLVGEVEPLRSLGVNVSAAAIATRALAMGLTDSEKALTPAMKAQAAYSIILEQTSNAQGDFARTSDGLANRGRILTATFEDLKVKIGSSLTPIVERFFGTLLNFANNPSTTKFFENASKDAALFATTFEKGFKTVIIPSLEWLVANRGRITVAIAAMGIAFAWAFPGAALIVGLGGIISLIGLFATRNDEAGASVLGLKIKVLNFSSDAVKALGQVITVMTRVSTLGASGISVKIPIIGEVNPLRKVETGAVDLITGPALDKIDQLREGVEEYLAPAMAKAAEQAQEAAIPVVEMSTAFDDVGAAADTAKEKVLTLKDALEDSIITLAEATELHLTAAMAGAEEGMKAVSDELYLQQEASFNLEKTISKLSTAFENSRDAAEKMLSVMAREAMEKLKAAQSAIFGRPTQEVALLDSQLAQFQLGHAQQQIALTPQLEFLKGQLANTAEDDDKRKEMLEKQITAIEGQLDAYDRQEAAISRNIDFFQAQTRVWETQLTAADATLLTMGEQQMASMELTAATRELSYWQRQNVQDWRDLVEGLRPAIEAVKQFGYILGIVASEGPGGFDQRVGATVRDIALGGGFNGVLA